MENVYVLEILTKDLNHATDMLRYDSCYQSECSKDFALYCLYCASYTPVRWASFGVQPKLVRTDKISVREKAEKYRAASGFLQGLRFAQQFNPEHRLVEGDCINIHLES